MQLRKIIQKRVRGALGGSFEGDRNAAVAINVGERNAVTKASSVQPPSGGESGADRVDETP